MMATIYFVGVATLMATGLITLMVATARVMATEEADIVAATILGLGATGPTYPEEAFQDVPLIVALIVFASFLWPVTIIFVSAFAYFFLTKNRNNGQ